MNLPMKTATFASPGTNQDAITQDELFVNIGEALREERRARSKEHAE